MEKSDDCEVAGFEYPARLDVPQRRERHVRPRGQLLLCQASLQPPSVQLCGQVRGLRRVLTVRAFLPPWAYRHLAAMNAILIALNL